MSRLLVVVPTCRRNQERTDVVNQTWGYELKQHDDVDFFYALAADEWARASHQPVILLDVKEEYELLHLKTAAILRTVLYEGFDFEYLVKVDDDALVLPDRLAEAEFEGDYCGRPCEGPFISGLFAAGGPGYVLARDAVEILADEDWVSGHANISEDQAVARLLKRNGIELTADWRFCHKDVIPPGTPQNMLSFHPMTPEQVILGWEKYLDFQLREQVR